MHKNPLPMPRLELRWRKPNAKEIRRGTFGAPDWACDYLLILPLQEADIRRKRKKDHLAVKLSAGTTCNSTAPDAIDSPYRDGAHASWDSEALGGIPVFVIGSDGVARRKIKNEDGFGYRLEAA